VWCSASRRTRFSGETLRLPPDGNACAPRETPSQFKRTCGEMVWLSVTGADVEDSYGRLERRYSPLVFVPRERLQLHSLAGQRRSFTKSLGQRPREYRFSRVDRRSVRRYVFVARAISLANCCSRISVLASKISPRFIIAKA
jgi:hypothetical protein